LHPGGLGFIAGEPSRLGPQNGHHGRREELFHILILGARDFFVNFAASESEEMNIQKIEPLSGRFYTGKDRGSAFAVRLCLAGEPVELGKTAEE